MKVFWRCARRLLPPVALAAGLACGNGTDRNSSRSRAAVLLSADGATSATLAVRNFPREEERAQMVLDQIEGRGVIDEAVLRAMRTVPRHAFVSASDQMHAYGDHPLAIENEQTISQPYIVAYMTELLRLKPNDRVLEIGTGSGYQAAVLAEIAHEVYTIEIDQELAASAAERLRGLGYNNINVLRGDGYLGWEAAAPYDAIIVTAAPEVVPQPLIEQLKVGGRMVVPVGRSGERQNLLLMQKSEDGQVITQNLLPVRFVPLVRE